MTSERPSVPSQVRFFPLPNFLDYKGPVRHLFHTHVPGPPSRVPEKRTCCLVNRHRQQKRSAQKLAWSPLLCRPPPTPSSVSYGGRGNPQRPCDVNYPFSPKIKRPWSPATERNRLNPFVTRRRDQETLNFACFPPQNSTGTSGQSLDFSGSPFPLGRICLMNQNFSLALTFPPSP